MKRTIALALTVVMAASVLAGCGTGNHKVTEGEPCGECHTEDKGEKPQASGNADYIVGTSFSVEAAVDKVWLCSLRFGGEEGTHLIPSRLKTLGTADYDTVSVQEPGLYALCFGNIDAPETVVIKVDPSVEPGAVVKLG